MKRWKYKVIIDLDAGVAFMASTDDINASMYMVPPINTGSMNSLTSSKRTNKVSNKIACI